MLYHMVSMVKGMTNTIMVLLPDEQLAMMWTTAALSQYKRMCSEATWVPQKAGLMVAA